MPKKTSTRPFRSGISDLRKVLEDSFQVRHIAVEIECCDADDDAQEVRRRMRANSFDVLGYRENGEVTGYVMQTRLLDGTCRKYRSDFQRNDLVPSNGPLAKLLLMMKDKPRLFVQQGASVRAIVTTGDLQKAPVRMVLFGFVSLMEMYLLAMVRQCYDTDDDIRAAFDMGDNVEKYALQDAEKGLRRAKRRRENLDLAEHLAMTGKYRLLTKINGFSAFFGYKKPSPAERFFKNCVDLRNRLAHGHDLLTNTSWDAVIGTSEQMERFLIQYEKSATEFEAKFGRSR